MLRGITSLLLAVCCFVAVYPSDAAAYTVFVNELTHEVAESDVVMVGTLSNAREAKRFSERGQTDFTIETIIKGHDILKDKNVCKIVNGKKVVRLPRYLPAKKNEARFVMFCDFAKGRIDPWRGIHVASESDLPKYLSGAVKLQEKPAAEILRYTFEFLENVDKTVAKDAFTVFRNAEYKAYADLATKLSADKLARWLIDAKIPPQRRRLYASLLGHCGTLEHARLLRSLLDDPLEYSKYADELMVGYTLLEPKEGWKYIRAALGKADAEFNRRYFAMQAAVFFHEQRPDVVSKDDTVKGMCLLLDQGDIADIAIEDLRKWKRWEVAGQVLELYGKKTHDIPIVWRAIVRFALEGAEREPRSAKFIANLRKKDAGVVNDAEELLKLETSMN